MLNGLRLKHPGLFITGTDTDVGKTVITCAIAAVLRRQRPGLRIGVSKPLSSGCRRDREGLVSEDAEALAHFADCRQPLDVINPIRFGPPLAPAVAAEQSNRSIDWSELHRCLQLLDQQSEAILIEGVGGLMVPLDPSNPALDVLGLITTLGYPVLIVARSGLGTLNHTVLTARLLQSAHCHIAGIVMNGFDADESASSDPSVASNRLWLSRLTGAPVLAAIPRVNPKKVKPHQGLIDSAILEAVGTIYWPDLLGFAAQPKTAKKRRQ